ncbi:MAG: sigma-70 family RNA polymerase sigma factor [Candidatus Zixiibacteriota bacterium]
MQSAVNSMEDGAEDRSIIELARDGDKNAYGRLVMKYQKRLFRFLFLILRQKDATEDIMQEAFVKGYLALASFEPDKPFYPWIATIARNQALNYIKKDAREIPAGELEDYIESIPDKTANAIDNLINSENNKKLASAVMSLPEQYRTVFVLRMMEKLSYEEISEKLKISPGTVDSRLFRARQKLVELLKDYL